MAIGSASGGSSPTNTVANLTRVSVAAGTLDVLGNAAAASWLRTWTHVTVASWWAGPSDVTNAYPNAACHGNGQLEFPFDQGHELRVLEAFPGMFTVLDVLDRRGRPV